MLLGITRTDGKSSADHVEVVIDYSSLTKAYGGGYGARLQVQQVPGCALTTPTVAACQKRTPIAFTNRAGAAELTADVPLSAVPASGKSNTSGASSDAAGSTGTMAMATTALAVTSGSSGSQGSYAATSLNPSSTWQASATGAFTYSYPIDVPAAVGGNAPDVALSYDSQATDGETSARNSQSSWIGDGWDYQPGFVERTYRSCNSLVDSNGNKILKGSGDECWGGDNATLSFGSHSGVLVPDGKDASVAGEVAQWRLQGDGGTVVQELSGATNGLQDGLYYRVLTTDGTAAYFGADHSPTAAGTAGEMQSGTPSDDSTHSAWGVPVLHPQSSDPCYDSAKGKGSKCADPEGWRWNLDFVVSPSGFVQRYDYSTEKNYYDLGGGQAATGDTGTLTSYTRGGTLKSISYGYTLADEQAGHMPSAQVDFTSAQRCQATSSYTDCAASDLTDSSAPHWPDVPYDLNCDSTDTTKLPDGSTTVPADVCIVGGPTFWTTTRLDTITTEVHVKDASTDKLLPVDSYKLGQVYSDAGGSVDPVTGASVDPKDAGSLQAVMWLQSIQHTGKDTYGNGNSDISLNQISFTGTEIDNRVNDFEPAAPPLYRPRISSIQTETGESIAIAYNETPCAGMSLSDSMADSNTNSCYPVYWTVPGASKPIEDWFNKVTVHQAVASDLTIAAQYKPTKQTIPAGSESQVTTYGYGAAAWHRDDSDLTDDQYRTWDQFRGFRTVTVQTGAAPEPVTQQTTTYLQGMDGDYKADGTRRSVSVDAKVGGSTVETVTDSDALAGTPLETDTYKAAGGTIDAETVNGPFSMATTASHDRTAWTSWTQDDNPGAGEPTLSTLPALTAHRVTASETRGYALLANGTWRQSRTDTAFDDQGRPISVDTQGDVTDAAQEKCAATTYATAPAANTMMLSYPDQVTSHSGPCSDPVSASNLISDSQTYYNGTLTSLGTFGTVSSTGQPTAVRTATSYTGGTEQWQTTASTAYDGAGRVTDAMDAAGQKTHTDFTPAWSSSGGNTAPTTSETYNSQQWKVTTEFDPLRGVTTKSIDPNGRETDTAYDALGRRTAVWLPGRDKATQSADITYTYSIDPGAVAAPGGTITHPGDPTTVTTKTRRDDNSYSTSVAIYDGMLQLRQTQTDAAAGGGSVMADTFYDSHGWPTVSYSPYAEPGTTPSSTLFAANEDGIPSETTTDYDGQGRSVASTLWHNAVIQWSTTTSYPGADETDSTAPAGGPSTATFTNGLGQTTRTVVKNTAKDVTLTGGQLIPSGTSLTSDSVRLTMQADGDLVLTSLTTGAQIWHSGTSGNAGAYAKFGTDGNLGVYTTTGTSKWSTGLTATTGATFKVRNDSTVAVVASNGTTALWAQGTAGAVPAADSTTHYTYTPAGQVSSVKDTAGNTWSYTYNLLGQETSQTDPDAGTSTYDKYDVMGNLLQSTDPRGQVLSYAYDWDNRVIATYSGAWSATPDSAKEQASYIYDTLAEGYPTSSTRYVGGASGKAYTQAVTGYNTRYQPLGSTLTVPAEDGFPAAGQTSPPSSGSVTYTESAEYTPGIGLLEDVTYQADGGLPSEQVGYAYTTAGLLNSFSGTISASSTPDYLDGTVHDPFGRVQQTNYGTVGKEVVTYADYDQTTGRVIQTKALAQPSTALDVDTYRYNQAGEITASDDLQNNTTHDTQCFSYDTFQRLTAAWTDTAGITDPTAAPVGAVGGCTTSSVQTTATSPVKAPTVGGPAPYWQTYSYDLLGDRTGMVDHDTTGNALNDTTQATTYAGANGATPATLPNQAGTTTTSNPTVGTATQTPSYADPAAVPAGTNVGDTVSRKETTTGPLVTGFALTGGVKYCIDDANANTSPGAVIRTYTCNNSAAQQWAFGTDGTVKVLGMCLDTTGNATKAGTVVTLDTCSSDATQKWKVTASGTIVSVANNTMCVTDPGASATLRTTLTLATCGSAGQTWTTIGTGTNALPPGQTQTLTYDTEGRTASVSTPSGTSTNVSRYLYDADGNLLEQTSSVDGVDKTRILYLFGGAEQITLNVTAKTCTALRNYTGPDGTTITRSSTGTVTYQLANLQGTATTAINASTLAVTRRYYDPYGNPRGTKPATWVAPDENHGYLGQPTDSSSGLDLLGARNYDPVTGRFLTPDPVFEAGDPNQMGGYTYAGDNPASGSDPSGLMPIGDSPNPTGGGGTAVGGGLSGGGGGGDAGGSGTSEPILCYCGGGGELSEVGGVPGGEGDAGGEGNGYRSGGVVVPPAPDPIAPLDPEAIEPPAPEVPDGILKQVEPGDGLSYSGAGATEAEAGNPYFRTESTEPSDPDTGTAAKPKPEPEAHPSGADDRHSSGSKAAPSSSERAASDDEEESGGKGTAGTKTPTATRGCSFSPDTPVLLTKGKTKPIGKIKKGDEVESADPTTGKHKGPREVQAVWINHDKDLLDVTIEGSDGKAATLHTTSNHPFWDDTTHTWVPAGELKPGDALNTATDTHATVLSTHATPGTANRWNLTVQQLHTYYVVAGGVAVLVHNTNGGCPNFDTSGLGPDNPTPADVVHSAQELTGTDGTYLYRGVTHDHWHYDEAASGSAVPRGGHGDPVAHSGDDTASEMTSWSPDLETAQEFSMDSGFGARPNLVLRIPMASIAEDRMIVAGQRGLDELEIQVWGTVDGCEVSCNGGPFSRP
ncbi:intein N-terminal splicing region/RHS repeat-associated core domain-containing protein [Actinacidiphila guanduensis]|uniref:Intein N-terminal splicing region/RHS repeat-associated core domain-containing protein n=2 Tax=Actinacidiphila guanduensis TaxID=310781 RepID=A0A1G9ZHS1_9ACTN|nr:intein N-terminal splicing region/RHS repeat-associated core domain-containing protein [Actinacidiphila guanduensis]